MSPSQKLSRQNSGSKPPGSIRYLQTRLKVLGRPRVWGSVSILLLAGGLFQYWGSLAQSGGSGQDAIGNPARRNSLGSGSDLSSPDFGNLPVSNIPQPYVTPRLTSPGLTSTDPQAAGLPTRPNTFNPFATHSVVARPSGDDGLDLPSAASEISGNPDSVGSEMARPISPLQSGLDRNFSPRQDLSSSDPMGKNSASPLGSSVGSGGDSFVGSNPTETMLAPVGAAQFQPYVPRTSPPPGSTGYTPPPAFRTPSNSGINDTSDFGNFSRLQPLPGFTSTQPRQSIGSQTAGSQTAGSQTAGSQTTGSQIPQYQSPQYLSPPNDPFSVPRTTPGRSIGGGQINTFSNP